MTGMASRHTTFIFVDSNTSGGVGHPNSTASFGTSARFAILGLTQAPQASAIGSRRYYDEFRIFPACNRIYWEGSHYERMQRFIQSVLAR